MNTRKLSSPFLISGAVHLLFCGIIGFTLPVLQAPIKPEISFLGSIRISEIPGTPIRGSVDQLTSESVTARAAGHKSYFLRQGAEKPIAGKMLQETKQSSKTLFPLERIAAEGESEKNGTFEIPAVPYQPLKLEPHDPP
jgi:hypothetical protein